MASVDWWQLCQRCSRSPSPTCCDPFAAAACQTVAERAVRTLGWNGVAFQATLLSPALDHLTLARVALYEAILEGSSFDPCDSHIQHAVDGLRRAGQQHELPRGLITRAWCSFAAASEPRLHGRKQEARQCSACSQRDLDEAWEMAERGPMPLFLADIHLHRARLFFGDGHYPWDKNPDGSRRGPKDDLAEARRLIEKHGYWRRKEELEAAEAAARNWPDSVE